jgi:hypothetical protein
LMRSANASSSTRNPCSLGTDRDRSLAGVRATGSFDLTRRLPMQTRTTSRSGATDRRPVDLT